nr:hypothetical protein [uncultured Desulfobacter sp.]
MKRLFLVLAAMILMAGSAQAYEVSYGWEDGGTILGSYSDITATNQEDVVHSGDAALELIDGAESGTPQAFVGWINGLTDGDVVTAGFWVYDTTSDGAPSGRIWGHYTDGETDVDSYVGSASGNYTYSDGSGWSYLEYTWTFDSSGDTRDGLIIEARTYSSAGDIIWIDDLTIAAPDTATILTPATASTVPVPNALILLGCGLIGLAGIKRKIS